MTEPLASLLPQCPAIQAIANCRHHSRPAPAGISSTQDTRATSASPCRDRQSGAEPNRSQHESGMLIHKLSCVSAGCACFAGRCWTVLKSRGREARLVEPGAPRSEGRKWRGFRQRRLPLSTLASSLMMRAPARVIGPETALVAQALVHDDAHATSSAPSQPGPPPLGCRHGAVNAPSVQNGGDQPGHHAMQHRRHTGNTPKTRQKHQPIAWSLEDTHATEALIPSVLDTSGPTTPDNRPHHHAGPTENNRHLETHE